MAQPIAPSATATAQKFAQTTFDHQKDSRFKLDEVHIKLDCSSCHREVSISADAKVIRYRPLGTQCVDCHDPAMLRERAKP